jgi:hypothetical protein
VFGLNFKPDVEVGNLLTAVSVLIAALTLARAWNSDRVVRRKEQADRVRNAAARTYAKLERGRDILAGSFKQSNLSLSMPASRGWADAFGVESRPGSAAVNSAARCRD